jgi:N,N'-diacetyllegionaminate synthase
MIAEMAYSHDGKLALAKRIVRDAAAAGADAISIHITHMPDYMVRNYGSGPGRVSANKETRPIYDYLVDISLSFEDWCAVAGTVRKTGLDLIIMPNDEPSLDFAKTLDPAALVVPPACFEDSEFVEAIGRTGKPVYVRVGGATMGEIEVVINQLRGVGNEQITMLYGHQNYPTAVADTNLLFLRCLKETFGYPVGIADHLDADDDFATVVPVLAVPLGITCIEKHMTHDRRARGEDFESALNRDEFKLLVERVRKAEEALGTSHATPLDEASMKYRSTVRKRLVAARDITAGERIPADAIVAKRADDGASPALKSAFVGATATADIPRDTGIDWSRVASRAS